MKTIRSFSWERTAQDEYKEILGYDRYNVMWKISLTLNGYHYFFCPGSGEGDQVSLFLYDDHTVYVYSERSSYGYAGVEKYYINEGEIIEADYEKFIQSDYEFMEIVGGSFNSCFDRFFAYSTMHKCKLLTAYDSFDDSHLLSGIS